MVGWAAASPFLASETSQAQVGDGLGVALAGGLDGVPESDGCGLVGLGVAESGLADDGAGLAGAGVPVVPVVAVLLADGDALGDVEDEGDVEAEGFGCVLPGAVFVESRTVVSG